MNRIFKIVVLGITFSGILSCRQQSTFVAEWKPTEVTIWNNYGYPFYINLNNKTISYDPRNLETRDLLTNDYKKNLFDLLSNSHLSLNSDSSFELEDHGFFTQTLSDTAWQGRKRGIWRVEENNSLLILIQSTGISKKYSILHFKKSRMKLGELYPGMSKPITGILLTR